MKKWILLSVVVVMVAGSASAQTKCEASIHGYRINTVYITGPDYSAVAWTYKHLSDATCMTPVNNAAKADAILELFPPSVGSRAQSSGPLTVSCESDPSGQSCIDSTGNEMDTECDASGDCSSYYGPSLVSAAGSLIDLWISSSWSQASARLYTPDYKLVWKSNGYKAKHWYYSWIDKLRQATFSATCKVRPVKLSDLHFRKVATKKCGVEFAPRVSIDIKKNARIAAKVQKQHELDQMKRNAEEAASRQKSLKH